MSKYKNNNEKDKNKFKDEKSDKTNLNKKIDDFISISDIPENNEKILDNIIQSSINGQIFNNYEKIKSVDANNYLNKENNPISSFNDFKINILNKKHSFNTPFIFCRKGIDLTNPEKIEEEKNYQIKRYRHLKSYKYSFNPSIRRQNSKIIQKWWKQKINPKISKRKKATKIQSVYRGYITRKHLNDIICISIIYKNFINKLRNVLSNYVRRNYFPKRYYNKKYAMEKIFPLKIKLFFRKWKNYKNNCEQKEKAAENMIKTREKNRYILLILKSFFNIWKMKCEEMNQNEKGIKSLNDKDKKYLAISKLFNKVEKFGNKNAFSLSKTNLRKYLMYVFQKKYGMKILMFYKKYKSQRKLKKCFDKWRNNVWKEKEKNLKIKILTNEIMTQIRLNNKENMRKNFNNLRAKTNLKNIKDLKRAKKDFLFPQGSKHIINCVRKYIFSQFFKKYIRKLKLRRLLLKIINNLIKKQHFIKWKKISKKEKSEENRKNKIKKIILSLSHILENKILSKFFYKWKSNILVDKFGKNKINNYNKFGKTLFNYINKKNNSNKKFSFQKIKNHINPSGKIIRKILIKIINNYLNKYRKLKLQKVINKWKKFVQFHKLNDLRAKNLETVARLSKAVYNTKKLSKNLYEWKEKNNLMKFINKNKLKDNVNNIANCLINIKNKRMKLFFDNMKKAKNNLLKKIILKNLTNNYIKNLLNKKFNLWKLNSVKKQNKIDMANIDKISKLKNIVNYIIIKKDKSNYASIKKIINKWHLISKLINKENNNIFLKNLKSAFEKIRLICVNHELKEPFNKIKLSQVNNKNIILNRLKKYFIKNDEKNLRMAFIRLFAKAKNKSKFILKANILFKLKQKYSQARNKLLLIKYFNKMKLINNFQRKEKIIGAKNIAKLLNNLLKKKSLKESFDKLKYQTQKFYLIEFTKKFFKLYELTEKRCLYHNFHRWKNIAKRLSFYLSQRQKGYEIIYNTLSKAFAYKKLLEILFVLISKYQQNNYKFFFNKYKLLLESKINCRYTNEIKNSKISKKIHFNFKKYIKPNISENNIDYINNKKNNFIKFKERQSKNQIISGSNYNQVKKEEHKNIIISLNTKKNKFYNERLIPYLIMYINKLRIKRLEIAFEQIYSFSKNHLFCKIFNSWNKSQNLLVKKNLIHSLKFYILKQKIIDYMRKAGIKKFTSFYLLVIKRRNDLFILVHLTKVFKRINQLKKASRFLRLWKLYMKLLKERAAQLEKMEKSFSQTYEKLSDDIFVDSGKEKSVQTQMMTFVDKINYGNSNRKNSKIFQSLNSFDINLQEKMNSDDLIDSDINFYKKTANNCTTNNFSRYKLKKANDLSKGAENKIKSALFKKK